MRRTAHKAQPTPQFSPNTEPIGRPGEDKLGRAEFAARIADSLSRWDLSKTSVVIGIEGAWGEGKSSLMTLLQSSLQQNGFLYREFEPWLFPDAQSMTVEFLRLIPKMIDASSWVGPEKRKALELFKSYVPSVVDAIGAAFPGGKIAADIAKKAADTGLDRFLKEPTVLEQRAQLQHLLANAKQRLAICVEDIDRLTAEEALRVATLIRLVGSFPNIVYILPYDRPHLTNLLSIALHDDPSSNKMGEGFRERLIQLEIPLPRASDVELQRLLDAELSRAIAEAGLDDRSPEVEGAFRRFQELWLFGVRRLFDTPRAITRFAGSIALVLAAVQDQVDLGDMLLIETLRLRLPAVYGRLRGDLIRYVGGGTLVDELLRDPPFERRSDEDRRKELQSELLAGLTDPQKAAATRILGQLLPQVWSGAHGTPERRSAKRFSESEFAERYFRLGIPPNDVSQDVVLRAVADAAGGATDELTGLLADVDKQDAVVLRLSDLVQAGDERARIQVRDAILNTAKLLAPGYRGGIELSWWERLALVFAQATIGTPIDDAYLDQVRGLPPEFVAYAIRLLEDERRSAEALGALGKERLDQLRSIGIAKMKELLLDPTIWSGPAPLGMYVAVLAKWDSTGVYAAVERGMAGEPQRANALLQARVDEVVGVNRAVVNIAQLRKEVDPRRFLELVKSDSGAKPEHIGALTEAVASLESS